MKANWKVLIVFLVAIGITLACNASSISATQTPLPPQPTYTPLPPIPTYTPLPTYTPYPTATAVPTATPKKVIPTESSPNGLYPSYSSVDSILMNLGYFLVLNQPSGNYVVSMYQDGYSILSLGIAHQDQIVGYIGFYVDLNQKANYSLAGQRTGITADALGVLNQAKWAGDTVKVGQTGKWNQSVGEAYVTVSVDNQKIMILIIDPDLMDDFITTQNPSG